MVARAVLVLLLTGCGLTAELDEPRVCQTFPGTTIPGAGVSGISGVVSLSLPVDLPLDTPGETNVSLYLTDVTLSSDVDGGSLPQLTSAEVVVVSKGASTTDGGVVALNYVAPADTPTASPLELTGTNVNLAPYLEAGALSAQLIVGGTLPTAAWSIDVQVCFRASATVGSSALVSH